MWLYGLLRSCAVSCYEREPQKVRKCETRFNGGSSSVMVLVSASWGHHMFPCQNPREGESRETCDASPRRSLRARQYATKVARQKPDHPLGKRRAGQRRRTHLQL